MVAKRSKFRNVKTNSYDSKRESRRAANLRLLERLGEISDLKEQVPFVLIPKQVDENGKCLERATKYMADFAYSEKGVYVVEDSKGHKTPDYIIKRKLMLHVHGIRVRES